MQLGLIGRRGGEALVLQEFDDRFEADVDILLAALGDGLAEQLRPARIAGGGKLGEPADDFFQPFEAICEPGLLDGKSSPARAALAGVGRFRVQRGQLAVFIGGCGWLALADPALSEQKRA